MFSRPSHALTSGPERAARARALKAETGAYLKQQRTADAQQRQAAVQRRLAQRRQAAEAAAAQAAAQPIMPVAEMTPREFGAAKSSFVRSLGSAG